MKKLLGIVALVAICGTMALGGQDTPQTYTVPVTVTVAPVVSMWSGGAVALTLSGKNAENSDAVESSITYINNVAAQISVAVSGALTPNVNFFIFAQGDAAAATAAMVVNAGAPAGTVAYTINGSAVLFKSVGTSLSSVTLPVVYAADAPNALPDTGSMLLTVTWTIAAGA